MEVADYLREFEWISDELKVLEIVAKMPFDAAMRHYSRRVVEVERYVMDLTDLLACEDQDSADHDRLSSQLRSLMVSLPK